MEVLLQKDVPALGEIGDIVDVSDGYARNYLLPQHLAVEPTAGNRKRIEEERARIEADRIARRQELEKLAERVNGREVTLTRLANEQGHLYGSVSGRDIADALAEDGLPVEASEVMLRESIRNIDTYEVDIRIAHDLSATVKVWIVPDKETQLSPEAVAAYESQLEAERAAEAETAAETEEESEESEPEEESAEEEETA